MNADNRQVVIVGAGHAGGSAAALLRQYGWPGSIVLLGDEPTLPYQRPPPMPASPAATASSSMTTPALLTDLCDLPPRIRRPTASGRSGQRDRRLRGRARADRRGQSGAP